MATTDYAARNWNRENSILEDLQALLRELLAGAPSDREKMEGLIQICLTDSICFEMGIGECTELARFYCEDLSFAFANCAGNIIDDPGLVQRLNILLFSDNYGIRESALIPALEKMAKKDERHGFAVPARFYP